MFRTSLDQPDVHNIPGQKIYMAKWRTRAKLGSIADVAITMLPSPTLEKGWDETFLVKTQYPAT